MVTGGKSVRDQVAEIRRLIEDAADTLRQANWAMDTLIARLGEPPDRPPPPQPVVEVVQPTPEPEATSPDAQPQRRGPPADQARTDRRRRHLWGRNPGPPDG